MTVVAENTVAGPQSSFRVWEKGNGPSVGYLAGLGGPTRWTPFLERLSKDRRVVVPSLPGFPGGGDAELLDGIADWTTATLDVVESCGLDGCDLIGASIGAMLAAEAASFSSSLVRRLVLISPLGLYDDADPVADLFATLPSELPGLLCCNADYLEHHYRRPRGYDETEWQIVMARAAAAAARLLWPLPDRGLAKRLYRLRQPTLIIWGADDRVVSSAYASRFAQAISGPTTVEVVPGAGHMADLDAAEEIASIVLHFLD